MTIAFRSRSPARLGLLLVALFLITPARARAQQMHSPPEETAQFGQLVGDWEVDVWVRNPDGSWMETPVQAQWRWEEVLDGHAIQDHWSSPSQELAGAMAYGTNLRIYDPAVGYWRVSWTASDDRDFMELTARQEGDDLRVYSMHDSGVPLRITFHGITSESFLWRMEIPSSTDGSWIAISRMEAQRVREED